MHVTSVLFLVQFNNFSPTMASIGVTRSYSSHLFLCALDVTGTLFLKQNSGNVLAPGNMSWAILGMLVKVFSITSAITLCVCVCVCDVLIVWNSYLLFRPDKGSQTTLNNIFKGQNFVMEYHCLAVLCASVPVTARQTLLGEWVLLLVHVWERSSEADCNSTP